MAKCKCTVMLDPEKAKDLLSIFPNGQVPVKSPGVEGNMIHSTLNKPAKFYLVDLKRLTKIQRQSLVQTLATKFSSTEDEVRRQLDKEGLPIREDMTTSVTCCPLRVKVML